MARRLNKHFMGGEIMTLEQSILLWVSFVLSIFLLIIVGNNSADIEELKREIGRLKDEVHFLKIKNRCDKNDTE